MSLMVLGDCVLDVYVFYKGLRAQFNPSEGPVLLEPGGACNVALAAARGGLKVHVTDSIGNDAAGRALTGMLSSAGIDISGINLMKEHTTPVSINLINARTKRHRFVGYVPSRNILQSAQLQPDAVFFDGYAAVSTNATDQAEKLRGSSRVFFDPGPVYAGSDSFRAIKAADYVLLNLTEYRRLEPAIRDSRVILKMGSRGAAIIAGGRKVSVGGIRVSAVSTVGAGDAFDGYFISALVRGLSEIKALELANMAAAEKIKGIGLSSFPVIGADFKLHSPTG